MLGRKKLTFQSISDVADSICDLPFNSAPADTELVSSLYDYFLLFGDRVLLWGPGWLELVVALSQPSKH